MVRVSRLRCLYGLVSLILLQTVSCITLKTTTSVPQISPQQLQDFLASPENWPKIVLSSHSVKSNDEEDLSKPLPVNGEVEEIFGLPPVLPLSVTWTCKRCVPPTDTKPGSLEFVAPRGLSGVASDCIMAFEIQHGKDGTDLELQISYQPRSPLAYLAIPLLSLDNEVALQILLPYTLADSLDRFRRLMGILYGTAGVAHAADCLLGSSQLLVAFGYPGYYELPPPGQAYALLWCAAGPLSFILSTTKWADWGLLLYGAIEVGGAWLVAHDTLSNVVVNALGVQTIVALAWLYSAKRGGDGVTEA